MTVARITLAIGAEPILVERAVLGVSAAARAADPTVQRSVIDAGDDSAVLQFREATAPNLFGDGGVVVVTGVDAADDRLAAAIREVIADLPDNVFLVFTHPGGLCSSAGFVDTATDTAGRNQLSGIRCGPRRAPEPYLILVSLYATCLRTTGSYFFTSIFSG